MKTTTVTIKGQTVTEYRVASVEQAQEIIQAVIPAEYTKKEHLLGAKADDRVEHYNAEKSSYAEVYENGEVDHINLFSNHKIIATIVIDKNEAEEKAEVEVEEYAVNVEAQEVAMNAEIDAAEIAKKFEKAMARVNARIEKHNISGNPKAIAQVLLETSWCYDGLQTSLALKEFKYNLDYIKTLKRLTAARKAEKKELEEIIAKCDYSIKIDLEVKNKLLALREEYFRSPDDDGSNDDAEEDFLASLDTSIDEDTETDELIDEAEPAQEKIYCANWMLGYDNPRSDFKEFKTAVEAYKFLKKKIRRYKNTTYWVHYIEVWSGTESETIYEAGECYEAGEWTNNAEIQALIDEADAEIARELEIGEINNCIAYWSCECAVTPEAQEIATQAEIDNATAEHFKQIEIDTCLWWINKTAELVTKTRKQIEADDLVKAKIDARDNVNCVLTEYARAILGNFETHLVPQAKCYDSYERYGKTLADFQIYFSTNEVYVWQKNYGNFGIHIAAGQNDNGEGWGSHIDLADYDNFQQFDTALQVLKARISEPRGGSYVDMPEFEDIDPESIAKKKAYLKTRALIDAQSGRNLAGWARKNPTPAAIAKAAKAYKMTVEEMEETIDRAYQMSVKEIKTTAEKSAPEEINVEDYAVTPEALEVAIQAEIDNARELKFCLSDIEWADELATEKRKRADWDEFYGGAVVYLVYENGMLRPLCKVTHEGNFEVVDANENYGALDNDSVKTEFAEVLDLINPSQA